MAYADYQHCINCDTKAFYDGDIDWDYQRAKQVASLCKNCFDLGYRLAVTITGEVQKGYPWENDNPYEQKWIINGEYSEEIKT